MKDVLLTVALVATVIYSYFAIEDPFQFSIVLVLVVAVLILLDWHYNWLNGRDK